MQLQMAIMKNEVAPMVCRVQFISPPSEIVAVDTPKAKEEMKPTVPILASFGSAWPRTRKDMVLRQFLQQSSKHRFCYRIFQSLLGDIPGDHKQREHTEESDSEGDILRELDGAVCDIGVGEGVDMPLGAGEVVAEGYGDHADGTSDEGEHLSSETVGLGVARREH